MNPGGAETPLLPNSKLECCMCGDCGISCELFQCTACKFRSQHRYCSNLYPKAESYEVCNWCLRTMEDDNKERSHNSSHSSSSNKTNSEEDGKNTNSRRKRTSSDSLGSAKSSSPSPSPSPSGDGQKINIMIESDDNASTKKYTAGTPPIRRRIITRARLDEMTLLRAKKESVGLRHANPGSVSKHVYRNKVRRYKLLDEVSS